MRRDSKTDNWKSKQQARLKYKERQVNKFIDWSVKQKGYLKLKELEDFEEQYNKEN